MFSVRTFSGLRTRSCTIFAALLILATLLSCPSLPAADTPEPPPESVPTVDHDFAAWASYFRERLGPSVLGYAFVSLQNGRIMASGTGGNTRATWEKENPGTPWTLESALPIASVSKTITAVGILKLWEEKKDAFSLDDPFWPYVQQIIPTVDESIKKITIRQLLTHRSGIEAEFHDKEGREKVLNGPVVSEPGTKFSYNNGNFYLLRLALEQISGSDYAAYMQEHVLGPMGIRKMTTRAEITSPTLAYLSPGEQKPGFLWSEDFSPRAGAEGWWASTIDLAKFLRGIRYCKVLSPKTTELMFAGGLGWYPMGAADNPAGYGHNGGWRADDGVHTGGISSNIMHFRDGVDAVLLMNTQQPDSYNLLSNAWLIHPLTVQKAGSDSSVTLPAEMARLQGSMVQLQSSGGVRNIGFWTDARDTLLWAMDVPGTGLYHVQVEYACTEEQAGSAYQVEVDGLGESLTGTVTGSGGWDQFHSETLPGVLYLPAGQHIVRVQAQSIPHFAVMNLKSLRFIPARGL